MKASGARIFLYLEDTGNNLVNTLLAAKDAGITGIDGEQSMLPHVEHGRLLFFS